MRGRELLAVVVLASGLVAAARLLVAGAYRALWDALWFGDWVPSVFGIVVFLVLLTMPLGARAAVWGASAALALLGLVGAVSDNADLLYLASAPVLALGSRVLAGYAGLRLGAALAMGLLLDTVLRITAGGAEVFDHPLLSKAYALILLLGSLLAVKSHPRDPGEASTVNPGPRAGGLLWTLLALELSLGYPNALLRLSGYHYYGTVELALLGGVAALALGLGAGVNRDLRLLIIAGAVLVALGGWGWAFGAVLALLGLGSVLRTGVSGGRFAAVLAGMGFVVFSVMAVGVYAYPYLGLWPLADRLELVTALALLMILALSTRQRLPSQNGLVGPGVGGWAVLLAALALSPFVAPHLAPSPGEASERGEGWVVVSYNLHQGFTGDARYNPWDVVGVLNALGTRLACLQEVDGGRLTSAYVDMPLLLRLSGYSVAYVPAIEQTYGVAVAYRGEIAGYQGLLLTSTGEQRAAVKAVLDVGWAVANAHLGLDAGERLVQAEELLDLALEGQPALILCGDFNEEEGDAVSLLSQYYELRKPSGNVDFTCCLGEETRVVIDYVAPLGKSDAQVLEYRAVFTWASDHLPVYAVIRVG